MGYQTGGGNWGRSWSLFFQIFTLLVVGFLAVRPLHAQVAGATLSGTITDASGAVVPNAKVSIKETATGINRETTSDTAGFYNAPNLDPGVYDVTTTASGFSTQARTGVTLTVGGSQVLNISLQVGQVTQIVEVSGEAVAIELASSSITGDVDSTAVRELPLNGRDWTSLATLQPGISNLSGLQPTAASGYNRGNRGYGNELSISGGRPQQNEYRIDGISANDYANSGPGSVIGGALGVDGIQEFSVVTSNYTAEYGRTSGGIVNAITRAGTNGFHGDAFEFLRNSALDARNFFDPAQIPAFKRNQFGGALGGPIRKDKTFFFADYEGIRQGLGETQTPTVPSADAHNGIIHNADGTTCTIGVASAGCTASGGGPLYKNSAGTVGVDPKVLPYLAAWPLPVTSIASSFGNTGIAAIGVTQVVTENFVSARVDHHFSTKDSLFGTFQLDNALLSNPDNLNDTLSGNSTRRKFGALEENHIFGANFFNNVRFGYNRVEADNSFGVSAINPVSGNLALGVMSGRFAPSVSATGITGFGGGLNTPLTYHWWWNAFQGYDDAFLTKGKHAMKFGFAVERDQDNVFGQGATYAGWAFTTQAAGVGLEKTIALVNLLENKPNSYSALLSGVEGFGVFGYRQTIYAAYFQDDIHWRPNLTVNLGVRYEMSTVPTEVHNSLGNLRSLTNANPGTNLGAPYFNNPTLRNFAPRVGFAWDPFHNGKSSVRGGFGMFDVLPLLFEYAIPSFSGAPFNLAGTSSVAPSTLVGEFPNGVPQPFGTALSGPATLRSTLVEFNPKRNYVMQWNLSVQRQIVPNLTAMVAYVGSHGIHLPFAADNENGPVPTLTSAGWLYPNPTGAVPVFNPGHGRIDTRSWGNSSSFNALELQVTKSMSHGFQALGSYTWSRSFDYGSGSIAGDPFANSIASPPFAAFAPELDRGPSDFDVRQNLSISLIWIPPTPHMDSAAASRLLGGWQLGSIFSTNTGTPFTPIWTPAGAGTNARPAAFPSLVLGCGSLVSSDFRTPGPNYLNYLNLSCFSLPMAPSFTTGAGGQCQAGPVAGSCLNLAGNLGRNTVPGPGLLNLDFSVSKNNYIPRISEVFNIQFRAEMFNILNHANFLAPIGNSNLFGTTGAPTAGAGVISAPTATFSRQIQFGLKVIF